MLAHSWRPFLARLLASQGVLPDASRRSGGEVTSSRARSVSGMTLRQPRSVLVWSGVISLLVIVSSVAGLADPRVYAQETQNWALQAKGQDVGNLLAVVVLLTATLWYRKAPRRAGLVWLGTLLYLIYAFVVYAMAVHLNYLFGVYIAVLGLAAWAVIFHVEPLRGRDLPPSHTGVR